MWHDGILTSILRNIKSSDGTRAVTMHPDLNYSASQAVAVSLSVHACSCVCSYVAAYVEKGCHCHFNITRSQVLL